MRTRPAGLGVMHAGYGEIFDRVVAAAESDERVRAAWLYGSVAVGLADVASDLDLLLTVADDDRDDFVGGLEEWLAPLVPSVLTRSWAPTVVSVVTPEGLRVDVAVEAVSAVATSVIRDRELVFEREPFAAVAPAPDPPAGPNPAAIQWLVDRFLRDVAMTEVLTTRDDWLLGIESVNHVRLVLYQLFVEANQPLPPYGMKGWSAKLTPEQRTSLESLPPAAATRDSVLGAKRATLDLFLAQAPRIAEAAGVRWPEALERTAVERFAAASAAAAPAAPA